MVIIWSHENLDSDWDKCQSVIIFDVFASLSVTQYPVHDVIFPIAPHRTVNEITGMVFSVFDDDLLIYDLN